ncbi:MAG: rod shape-determining protein RodA [Nitrospirota bacterium]
MLSMLPQKRFDLLDWFFFGALFAIFGISLLTIYSVTSSTPPSFSNMPLYLKQFFWILLGMVVFTVFATIDYHESARFAYPLYFLSVFLLLVVLVLGREINGAQRWISIGTLNFQPSELTKVSTLLLLAKYFSDHPPGKGLNIQKLAIPCALLLVPMILVLKQPDLGTALAILSIFFSIVFVIGFRSKFLIYFLLLSLMIVPFIGQVLWGGLKQYQKDRIITFLNPANDPMGTGWHIIQSKIAIGSAGFWGKGLGDGTQSQLKFLPERATDFIFAVFSEEWGFMGIVVLFSLFAFLCWWGIDVAHKAKDLLGVLIAVGIVGILSFYFLVNAGMALAVLPVVGVPLPFVSYGGSAMVTNLGLLGLLLNIKLKRFVLFH